MPLLGGRPDFTTLPDQAMRDIAREIEQAVARGEREFDIADRDGIVLDPQVRQAIRTRAARAEILSEFLDQGWGGEQRSGLVKLLSDRAYKQATTRRQRDRDALLVMNENENRWILYEGIVKGSNLPPKSLDAIQAIFHEARVAELKSGQRYEDAAGEWVAK